MSIGEFFEGLEARAKPERIAGLDHSYLFDVQGEGRWLVEVRDGKLSVTPDPEGPEADVEFTTSAEVFEEIVDGRRNPATAYMTGKLKVAGDLGAALELKKLFA